MSFENRNEPVDDYVEVICHEPQCEYYKGYKKLSNRYLLVKSILAFFVGMFLGRLLELI